jgi:hypothetical protein
VIAEADRPEDDVEQTSPDGCTDTQRRSRAQRRFRDTEGDSWDRKRRGKAGFGERATEERDRRRECELADVVERTAARNDQQECELQQRRREPHDDRSAEVQSEGGAAARDEGIGAHVPSLGGWEPSQRAAASDR